MKVHIPCGDVFLEDYINCDIKGKLSSELKNRPKGTTVNEYFKGKKVGKRGQIIVDKYVDMLEPWHFLDRSVEEVLMISGIEHFTLDQARFIVHEVKRILMPGGLFKVDFPDIIQTIKRYYFTDPEYCMRLIYCSGTDEYSFHRWGYNQKTFKELLGKGWKKIEFKEIVKHDYPMIGCIAEKK